MADVPPLGSRAILGLFLGVALGCQGKRSSAISVAGATRELVFTGLCDASGAVALSQSRFAVADDEGNVLRVYDADRGGDPIDALDLSSDLQLPIEVNKKGRAKRPPETDLEAATRVGDLAFWLTSHARNSSGKPRPERQRFCATKIEHGGKRLTFEGDIYEALLDDLAADPRFTRFDLPHAAERGPKEPGGLNIEGMTERPEGGVYIGFRNPIPNGKALLFALRNPAQVVHGERPEFGDPLTLDLGGLGVRSLSYWRGRYLVVAGHHDSGGRSWLYTWDGHSTPKRVQRYDFTRFNPEGFFTPDDRDEVLVLSDDGNAAIDGKDCKKLKDPTRKQFRGVWLKVM
jgi:Protein of unknown function (DUF3616)